MATFAGRMDENVLRKMITQIQLDQSLTDAEKAKKRQELLSGRWTQPAVKDDKLVNSTGMCNSNMPGMHACCGIPSTTTILSSSPSCADARTCLAFPQILKSCNPGSANQFRCLAEDGARQQTGKSNADDSTIFDETLKCAMCMDLCTRPITV